MDSQSGTEFGRFLVTYSGVLTAIATLGGAGVVLWQLRSATKALRSAAYQGIVTHSLKIIENALAHDEILDLLAIEMSTAQGTPTRNDVRWHFMMLAPFRHFENLYVQHGLGSFNDEQWKGYEALLRYYLRLKRFKTWWSDERPGWFSEPFRRLVDGLL